ncbi:hypothetical protein ACWT_6678 [Actinoplanes sp. SE50]|uniref:hypothetical protein n=1 Tax=unclassified Actinoplanes TaxID=2626549 RepID=UPI00023ECA40|nr:MULTISPECIES: hypothetical protein [unclassified Actinoplanes]AEV87690.1 hypothetical protein ACPL_6808 [Actinoplanes sp. SE50/110]ATO86093.1 hypothetical protein ACWT_6678 [Actinoplanes sp. SE50]SLM03507.1 hypothetical protein ACSP50_6800 [Actinoplanes sp. SE50/110]
MTTVAVAAPPRRHRPLTVLTWASLALAVIAGIGLIADARILTGVPIWLKPFKFAVSFALYAWTLAWLISVLPRRSRVAEGAATIIGAASVIELAVITVQVIRGTTSHYNQSTPLNSALWSAMGMSIMVLFVAHLTIGVVALRQRVADRATAYAIRLGLLISLIGMLAAFPMTTRKTASGLVGAHSVGVPDGGPGLPLTGWSTVGGDLRIGHFVGLHALQVLPLLAYALGRWAGDRFDATTRARLVLVAGTGYGVLGPLLTWQAMRAEPLLRPSAVTLAAFLVVAVATAAGLTAVASSSGRMRA